MTSSSVLLIFLLLCCFQMMLVSMPTCKLPGKVVLNTHNLLQELGGPFPVHCRQYNSRILSPDSALTASAKHHQCRWTSSVVYEFLRGAGLMFAEYYLPEGEGGLNWDEPKLDHYLNLQDRLVDDHQCVNNTEAAGVLSSYFSSVKSVVEQQDSAACGWHALRSDLLKVLKSALQIHRNCFNWTRAH
ncbi:LOW QUALITY PROTEIN: interferon phi 2 [Melanotaenia boesemani]|uniref:LOW QUALITY PROTEIN: interferon phi 2 n=1 Tax=Melanotaenia boesemani TaxID=1250792 RepID=UPI001C03C077|nr:LOW QUALITY PROTEIN: interferon phi 2 [Melanotaenia boesemani]